MATLTVSARGQIALRRNVLRHLGIQPGEKVQVELLPNGRAEISADRQKKHTFRDLRGILAAETNGARLTIEEIKDAIAESGAAAGAGLSTEKPLSS